MADDLIEEIKEKAFDEKTVDFQAINKSQLTLPLGYEGGETWPNFNDIDDYDGYTKDISLPHAEGYNVRSWVYYVNSDGTEMLAQTYYKKVKIIVTSPYLRQPLFMSFIFSLHSKN